MGRGTTPDIRDPVSISNSVRPRDVVVLEHDHRVIGTRHDAALLRRRRASFPGRDGSVGRATLDLDTVEVADPMHGGRKPWACGRREARTTTGAERKNQGHAEVRESHYSAPPGAGYGPVVVVLGIEINHGRASVHGRGAPRRRLKPRRARGLRILPPRRGGRSPTSTRCRPCSRRPPRRGAPHRGPRARPRDRGGGPPASR